MKKWLNSANHAASGLIFFIRTERNARIELSIALGVLLLGAWLGISILEMSIVLLCIGLVIAAEAFNTAIERMADFQSREIHPDIKRIKDIAAGAVLVTAIASGIIGLLIFGPPLWEKIFF